MEVYDACETTIRHVLPKLGVPAGVVPGLGWRIHWPSIENLIFESINDPALARRMHDLLRTLRSRTKRRAPDVTEGP